MSGIITALQGAAYNDNNPIDDEENHKCPPHVFRHNIGLKNGIIPFQYWACHYCHIKRESSETSNVKNRTSEINKNSSFKTKGKTSDNLKGKTHD